MNRIISAEFYKIRHCKLLWPIPAVYFVAGFYWASYSSPVFRLYGGLDMFAIPTLAYQFLSCATAMLTGYVIGMDFSCNTIQNSLSIGVSRKNYYFSRMGVLLLLTALFYLLTLLGYTCGRLPVFQRLIGNPPPRPPMQEMAYYKLKLAVCTIIGILQLWADVSTLNAACYFIRKQLPAMVTGLILILMEVMLRQFADFYGVTLICRLFDYAPVRVLKNTFEIYAIHDRILTFGYLKFGISAPVIIMISSSIGYIKFRCYSGND